jgi:hypothetical protein
LGWGGEKEGEGEGRGERKKAEKRAKIFFRTHSALFALSFSAGVFMLPV